MAEQRSQSLEQEELADLKAKKTDRGIVLTLGDDLVRHYRQGHFETRLSADHRSAPLRH